MVETTKITDLVVLSYRLTMDDEDEPSTEEILLRFQEVGKKIGLFDKSFNKSDTLAISSDGNITAGDELDEQSVRKHWESEFEEYVSVSESPNFTNTIREPAGQHMLLVTASVSQGYIDASLVPEENDAHLAAEFSNAQSSDKEFQDARQISEELLDKDDPQVYIQDNNEYRNHSIESDSDIEINIPKHRKKSRRSVCFNRREFSSTEDDEADVTDDENDQFHPENDSENRSNLSEDSVKKEIRFPVEDWYDIDKEDHGDWRNENGLDSEVQTNDRISDQGSDFEDSGPTADLDGKSEDDDPSSCPSTVNGASELAAVTSRLSEILNIPKDLGKLKKPVYLDSISDDDEDDHEIPSVRRKPSKPRNAVVVSDDDSDDSLPERPFTFTPLDVSSEVTSKPPSSVPRRKPPFTPKRNTIPPPLKLVDITNNDSDDMDSPFLHINSPILKKPVPKTPRAHTTPARKSVLHSFPITTPKTQDAAITPAYQREYKRLRDTTVKDLFNVFNRTIFDLRLPDIEVTWNKRLTKTAGYCYYYKCPGTDQRKARIELAEKVCDSVERLRDTFIHELCHAAAWIIDGTKAGHGPIWKRWADKAKRVHPDLPVISRCHQFKINTKYTYRCLNDWCGKTIGRHSKSLKCCPICKSCVELTVPDGSTPAKVRTPNKFALFVKENFKHVKDSQPDLKHGQIMKILGERFANIKVGQGV